MNKSRSQEEGEEDSDAGNSTNSTTHVELR